jgi:hypothetical protein
MKITAKIARGPGKGTLLEPHPYPGGKYVVSKTRFERDYIFVYYEEIPSYRQKGLSVRMSDPVTKSGPRVINPRSITVTY